MGSICFSKRSKIVHKAIVWALGIHVSVPYCEIVLKSLETLDERLSLSYEKVPYVLDVLQKNDHVKVVNHPLVHSPSAHSKYFRRGGPNVIRFFIDMGSNVDIKNWKSFRDDIGNIVLHYGLHYGLHYVTSFGHEHHSIDSYPNKIWKSHKQQNKNGVWLRLYVGWKKELLKEELCIALEKIISEIYEIKK